MKYKTSELESGLLDAAVAKANGWPYSVTHYAWPDGTPNVQVVVEWMPSRTWAHGGPIIEREHIGILPATKEVKADRNYRRRTGQHFMPEQDGWVAGYDPITYIEFDWGGGFREIGPMPLVAAMRCFLSAKLGAEVDL